MIFKAAQKPIRYNVNIALVTVPTRNVIFRCKDLSLEAGRKPTESPGPNPANCVAQGQESNIP